jgi:hypothetical protein
VRDVSPDSQTTGFEVAVIGMAGRYPKARDLAAFWRNIRDGVECLTEFSDEQLLASGVEPEWHRNPRYVKAGGVLEAPEFFDAAFFGITPRDAEMLDPQHRFFLECSWEALESAGYTVTTIDAGHDLPGVQPQLVGAVDDSAHGQSVVDLPQGEVRDRRRVDAPAAVDARQAPRLTPGAAHRIAIEQELKAASGYLGQRHLPLGREPLCPLVELIGKLNLRARHATRSTSPLFCRQYAITES